MLLTEPPALHQGPISLDDTLVRADAASFLNGALLRTGLKLPAIQAHRDMPPLQQLMLRLAYFVTDQPINPYSGRPILDGMVDNGLQAIYAPGKPDAERITRFLQCVLARATDLLAIRVSSGTHTWAPSSGEPLGGWIHAFPAYSVHQEAIPADANPVAFRSLFLGRLASESELVALNTSPAQSLAYPR